MEVGRTDGRLWQCSVKKWCRIGLKEGTGCRNKWMDWRYI